MNQSDRIQDDDVIVIQKSTLITIGVALLFFILGGIGGYFVAVATLDRQAPAVAEGGVPQAQPTPLPAVVENVSIDDDPIYGPASAAVTIIEFSDFM